MYIETLTPALLHELIDRIEVHASERITGSENSKSISGNIPNKVNKNLMSAK